MSTTQSFRSALNGFNREDVVNYISFMSNKHESQLNALRAEADELRQALEIRDQENQELRNRVEELEELQCLMEQSAQTSGSEENEQRLEQEVALRDQQIRILEQTIAQQKEMLTSLKLELTAAQTARMEQAITEELNAYRRAESAERRAMERVNQMYDRANGAMAEAAERIRQNAGQIGLRASAVAAELELLNQTLAAAEEIMEGAGEMLSGLRPDMDN